LLAVAAILALSFICAMPVSLGMFILNNWDSARIEL
jgi:hypothetical protein